MHLLDLDVLHLLPFLRCYNLIILLLLNISLILCNDHLYILLVIDDLLLLDLVPVQDLLIQILQHLEVLLPRPIFFLLLRPLSFLVFLELLG